MNFQSIHLKILRSFGHTTNPKHNLRSFSSCLNEIFDIQYFGFYSRHNYSFEFTFPNIEGKQIFPYLVDEMFELSNTNKPVSLSELKESLNHVNSKKYELYYLLSCLRGFIVLGTNTEISEKILGLLNEASTRLGMYLDSILLKESYLGTLNLNIEKKAELSNNKFSSPLGTMIINQDFTIDHINAMGLDILGYTKEELLQTPVMNLLVPSEKIRIGNLYNAQNLDDSKNYTSVFKVNHKSKKELYCEGIVRQYPNNSEHIQYIATFKDVTKKFSANKKLEETKRFYLSIYENMFDAILVYNYETNKIIDCNESATKLLGTPKNQLLDASLYDISPDYSAYLKSINLHEQINVQKEKVGLNQSTRFDSVVLDHNKEIVVNTNIIPTGRNKYEAFLIMHNISDNVKQEKIILSQLSDLNAKKEQLEKYINSNLQLENFAYIASHDLKAPLRSVSSFSNLLKLSSYDKLDEKEKKYLDIISDSSDNMQSLIDDLLLFSKVNNQKAKIKHISFKKILERVLRDLEFSLNEVDAIVNVKNMPDSIWGDRSMMAQLFQNLISNAIKFRKKNIQLEINIDFIETREYWEFKISDNGIGIHPDDHEVIFAIFKKLHSNEKYDGNGLGLTICQKIIEKHSGEITVESNLGDGVTIKFSIKKPESLFW